MIKDTTIYYVNFANSPHNIDRLFTYDEVVLLFNNYNDMDPKHEPPTIHFDNISDGRVESRGTVTLAEDKRSLVYHYDQSCQSCQYANLYLTYCHHLERPIYPEYMNTACEYHKKLKPSNSK